MRWKKDCALMVFAVIAAGTCGSSFVSYTGGVDGRGSGLRWLPSLWKFTSVPIG